MECAAPLSVASRSPEAASQHVEVRGAARLMLLVYVTGMLGLTALFVLVACCMHHARHRSAARADLQAQEVYRMAVAVREEEEHQRPPNSSAQIEALWRAARLPLAPVEVCTLLL